MPEKPNERMARHVVAQVLGTTVRRFEDGTANSQVDAVIESGGRDLGALEIVADHEDAFNAQWDALDKVGHQVTIPELRGVWSAQLARRARVKDVVQKLPALMLALQADVERDRKRDMHGLPDEFKRLGIRMLYPLEDAERSGYVNLHAEGWSGFASSETMGRYVERILDGSPDVPAKLAHHPAADKHAFIWTTIGTEYGVQSQLERREQPLPIPDPDLPPGVTHVWVAGSFTSQGALTWFPDRGWWRPDWERPESGSLVLGGWCFFAAWRSRSWCLAAGELRYDVGADADAGGHVRVHDPVL